MVCKIHQMEQKMGEDSVVEKAEGMSKTGRCYPRRTHYLVIYLVMPNSS